MLDDKRYYRALFIPLAALVLLSLSSQALAQVRGVSYTVSPVGEQIFFDDNAGLERAFLYGGEIGLGFGRFVELEGIYLRRDGLTTDFGQVDGISEETRDALVGLTSREVDLQRYGGKLKLNLPTENVVPFVLLGAGIIRLEPENLNATRTIYLGAGGGLQFSVGGRYALTLSAQRFAYRYNLGSTFFDDLDLADIGLASGSFNQTQVNNWALRAGLQAYVGGRAPGEETTLDQALREQFSGGLRGLSLRIEPFAGSLSFDEELDFQGSQRFAGLFAGINLGPYVGLRGFYWRGVGGGLVDFEDIQAYGGEMRFELTTGQSLTPYITVGGGYMDALSGYQSTDGSGPGDEPFVVTGAGAVLPINESLSINAGARSVMMGKEGADNVDDPGEVRSSWMYTGGVSFAFGRRSGALSQRLQTDVDEREGSEAALRAELRASQSRLDSLAQALERIRAGEPVGDVLAERIVGDTTTGRGRTTGAAAPRTAAGSTAESRAEPRMVTIPLPEQGELYVRFGDPGGVSIETVTGEDGGGEPFAAQSLSPEQIEQVVRQSVREQLQASGGGVTAAQIDRIESRLTERLDALENRLQARLDTEIGRLAREQGEPTTVVIDRQAPDTPRRAASDVEVNVRTQRTGPESVRPYTGALFGTPDMGLLGVRLDMDTPFLGPVDLQPEFALGLGADTYAYFLGLDAEIGAPSIGRFINGLRPYAALGAGMIGFNEAPADKPGVQLTINGRLGADFEMSLGRIFAEIGTLDFFEYNRVAVGYRFGL